MYVRFTPKRLTTALLLSVALPYPVSAQMLSPSDLKDAPASDEAETAPSADRNPSPRGLLPLGATLGMTPNRPTTLLAQQATNPGKEGSAEATLPTVRVKATAEHDAPSYQGGTTNIGKLPQLPKDIPQSVTVVTNQLMTDRAASTLRDALHNVAGLTFNAGEGGRIGDNITLRGYSAVGDLYLDGMRDVAQYNREIFNLQQIDILRGSASMLFGRGSTGGVINQVSKRPLPYDRNEAVMTYGSYDYKRATADLNKTFGESAAMRLNLMQTDASSFREGVHSSRWGVAPSVSWGLETPDEFTIAYYRLSEDNIPDFGVPYFQGRPLNVPVSRFYGLSNADYEKNDTGIATASYTHRFSADTNLRTVLRQADYERDLRATAPRLVGTPATITDATVINRQRQARGSTEHSLTSQTDLTTKLSTGSIKHLLLAGVELVREKAHRWNNTSALANPTTTVGDPNANPALPSGFDQSFVRTGDVRYDAHTIAFYAQDIVELARHWKLVLGARHDDFRANYQRPAPQGDLSRTDRGSTAGHGDVLRLLRHFVQPLRGASCARRPWRQHAAGEEPQHRGRRQV